MMVCGEVHVTHLNDKNVEVSYIKYDSVRDEYIYDGLLDCYKRYEVNLLGL